MVVTKLSQKEWAYAIERGLRKRKVQSKYREERFWQYINNHRILTITVGAAACIAVIKIWGFQELLNMLLSWVIGIVVVTTLVAGILHPRHPNGRKR